MASKTNKYRGQRTHGRGFKSGRGAGIRGGRGNTGLHKHKMKSMVKYAPQHFGRHGFKRHVEREEDKAINLMVLQSQLGKWLKEGKIKENKGTYEIDLNALGYTKLLSKGKVSFPMKVSVKKATSLAIKKIEEAKGNVKTS
ncbi:MAG: uL15m family ribosomal protein [Thermoplasmata archaeon]